MQSTKISSKPWRKSTQSCIHHPLNQASSRLLQNNQFEFPGRFVPHHQQGYSLLWLNHTSDIFFPSKNLQKSYPFISLNQGGRAILDCFPFWNDGHIGIDKSALKYLQMLQMHNFILLNEKMSQFTRGAFKYELFYEYRIFITSICIYLFSRAQQRKVRIRGPPSITGTSGPQQN